MAYGTLDHLLCSVFALGWSLLDFPNESAMLAISAYGLSYSLGAWNGRPEVSLLLKVIDKETGTEAIFS